MSLEGASHWEGFYTYQGQDQQIPVRAELTVQRGRLTGTMEDLVVEHTTRIADLPPDQVDPKILRFHSEAFYILHLHPHSSLHGSAKGFSVSFVKAYLQTHQVEWHLPGQKPQVYRQPSSPVEYNGSLSPDGRVLEGTWTITTKRFFGLKRWVTEGKFRLERL